MMRTDVNPIEVGMPRAKQMRQPRMNPLEPWQRDLTARGHRLVRDDDRKVAGSVEPLKRLGHPREQRQLLGRADVIDLDVYRAVAIEEDGRALHTRRQPTGQSGLDVGRDAVETLGRADILDVF